MYSLCYLYKVAVTWQPGNNLCVGINTKVEHNYRVSAVCLQVSAVCLHVYQLFVNVAQRSSKLGMTSKAKQRESSSLYSEHGSIAISQLFVYMPTNQVMTRMRAYLLLDPLLLLLFASTIILACLFRKPLVGTSSSSGPLSTSSFLPCSAMRKIAKNSHIGS